VPKPLFGENGSGMHTHHSLWKGGEPLFHDERGYGGLSDIARWYIGGLLKHACSRGKRRTSACGRRADVD
jgi:glutamine synthetase